MPASARIVFIWWPLFSLVVCQFDPHFTPGHSTIVQLVEWRYADIERECLEYLGPNGFGGVQLSPVNEVRDGDSWTDRYEPVSYRLLGRSGNESALRSMVNACNEAGVRVYVEVVLNHMARPNRCQGQQCAPTVRGSGGSIVNPLTRDYPDAPYAAGDFNEPCRIANPWDAHELRNCWVDERPDLNHGLARVRQRQVDFLNRLLTLGVAGFFIDSALHMWPEDLRAIYDQLQNLSTTGEIFPPGRRPFMCYDLFYHGSAEDPWAAPAVNWADYAELGVIADDRFAHDIGDVLLRRKPFHYFVHLGTRLGYVPREKALVYVSSLPLQRLPDTDGELRVVSSHNKRAYQIALAFMLAHRYGLARLTSSYEFAEPAAGAPSDSRYKTVPVQFDDDGSCRKPWICEHRWPVVKKMMRFRRATNGTGVVSWVDNGQNQIAFCRDRVGFIAFNAEVTLPLKAHLHTCLDGGTYCDLISGDDAPVGSVDGCTGTAVTVDYDGKANIFIRSQLDEPGVTCINTACLDGTG